MNYEKIEELVTKAQSGDEDSFAEIYYLMYQKLYFFSLGILKDVDLAEDVVQDVFIIVKDKLDTLKNPRLFVAWINKITYNQCMREIKKQKSRIFVDYDEKLMNTKSLHDCHNPERTFEKKEERDSILKLIDQLSDTHKSLILLKYYNGLKNDEIASIMEIPVGTVKSGLYYAKLNLRKLAIKNKMYGILFIPNLSHRLNIASRNSISKIKYSNSYNGIKEKKINIFKNKRNILLMTGLVTITSGAIYSFLRIDLKPSITSIKCNPKGFTKNSIDMEVFVENKKYINKIYIINSDKDRINGKYSNNNSYLFKIDENGEYTICVETKSNNKIYKNIDINSIDREKPKIIDYEYNENKLNIKIEDNLSKIDYDKTYIDNIDKSNISIDKVNNEISIDIPKTDSKYLILFLFDKAGNQSKYRISIKYK